ncbi:Uncharacterised protein [Mycobacterium tuberculosis]|nr:Uncharacterised protein [Mycobacterium tuberculosis]CKU99708.1 Uncharacterised protein [Mycobacterium tuberculosis]
MSPSSAKRARIACGPHARCSPSATENPTRAATLASPNPSCWATVSGGIQSGAGSLARNRSISSGRTASTPTPRGPAIHLRDEAYVTSAPTAQSTWPRPCAASTTSGSFSSVHSCATIASGCATPRWLATTVRCTRSGGSSANMKAASSSATLPSCRVGNGRTSKPWAAITARFGPYSPGKQASVRFSPGQLPSSRSNACSEPVVNTTSASGRPLSAATAARPASSTAAAASAAT